MGDEKSVWSREGLKLDPDVYESLLVSFNIVFELYRYSKRYNQIELILYCLYLHFELH